MTLSCPSKQAADTVPEAAALRFSTGIAGAGARIGTGRLVLLLFLPGNHPSSSRLAVRGGAAVVLVLRLRLCGCGRRRTVGGYSWTEYRFPYTSRSPCSGNFRLQDRPTRAVLQRCHIFRIGEVRRFQPLMDWSIRFFHKIGVGRWSSKSPPGNLNPSRHRRYNKE